MSRKSANETLAVFLHQQDASTLVDILLELASESEVVRRRLERLSVARDGKRLAAAFRKTLNGWTRSRRYLDWDEARQFFREQQDWLAQIERELLPVDPMRALELVEDYIASDAHWFERADDSAGLVGETVREACRLWLRCAARCETPADFWPERLATLYDHDEYGAREELLRRANLLLDEAHLRGLVARYEAQQDAILAAARARGEPDLPRGVFHPATAMVLLAEALQDPDVQVRATLRHSPQPNELQKEAFVRHYLEVGRPADALPWLDGPWQRHEDTRLRLRAQALQQLGRRDEAVLLRQQAFERTLTVSDFRDWMELLPPLQQSAAVEHARAVARAWPDPVAAAELLLETGDGEGAQGMLVQRASQLDGRFYELLVPLAKKLEAHQLWTGATAVYRALLLDILSRGQSQAYRHAARYWAKLQAIAQLTPSLEPLCSHARFVAEVRRDHGRKWSFWQLADS